MSLARQPPKRGVHVPFPTTALQQSPMQPVSIPYRQPTLRRVDFNPGDRDSMSSGTERSLHARRSTPHMKPRVESHPPLRSSTPALEGGRMVRPREVLDRMQSTGWLSVSSSDEPEPSSPMLEKRGSADSGFSEGLSSKEDRSAYVERWDKLKKAVWGKDYETSSTSTSLHAEHLWDTLRAATIAVSTTLTESIAKARNDEDDGMIGPDGDTKLSRAIKEYHVSRAKSIDDLPDWLRAEVRGGPTVPPNSDTRPNLQVLLDTRSEQSASAQRDRAERSRSNYSEEVGDFGQRDIVQRTDDQPRSRAAERLRAMRDARRNLP